MSAPIWDLVISDMRSRDEKGAAKYNRRLEAFDGRRTLQDAYEEALDLAVYLKKEIAERRTAVAAIQNAVNIVRSRIQAYDGGDRPPSPPAWLLQLEFDLSEALREAGGAP